jgi:hypothetical protein
LEHWGFAVQAHGTALMLMRIESRNAWIAWEAFVKRQRTICAAGVRVRRNTTTVLTAIAIEV